jgi:hypothetical protein
MRQLRTMLALAIGCGCCFQTGVALASTPDAKRGPPRWVIGLRTGLWVPTGQVAQFRNGDGIDTGDDRLDRYTQLQIPLQLELGYKLRPPFLVGAYASGSVGPTAQSLKEVCDSVDTQCRVRSFRLGLQATWTFNEDLDQNWWIGLGLGVERLRWQARGERINATNTYGGVEFTALQLGANFRLSNILVIGPFASASWGRFETQIHKDDNDKTNYDFPHRAWHAWFGLGVRVAFDFAAPPPKRKIPAHLASRLLF